MNENDKKVKEDYRPNIIQSKVPIKGYTAIKHNGNIQIVDPHLGLRKKKLDLNKNTNQIKKQSSKINSAEDVVNKHLNVDSTLLNDVDERHTNGVYHLQDGDDSLFFKPSNEEKWFDKNKNGDVIYARDNLRDDQLYKREVGAYEVSKLLNMNTIPPTKIGKTDKGVEGSLQMDSHDFKLKHSDKKFDKVLDSDDFSMILADAFDDGGVNKRNNILNKIVNSDMVDLGVFDFIIGNMDRHEGNFHYAYDSKSDKYSVIGIDHGFSFPEYDNPKMLSDDFNNTQSSLWNPIGYRGGDVSISDGMKKSLSDVNLSEKIKNSLTNLNLPSKSIEGVSERLKSVQEYMKNNNGKLTGKDLIRVMNPYVEAYENDLNMKKTPITPLQRSFISSHKMLINK